MTTHRACILLGSNIEPEQNTRRAVAMLKELCRILAFSSCWETGSVGYNGPNFINLAVLVETDLDTADFKQKIIDRIKTELLADEVQVEHDLALIMVVGEGMRHNVGTTSRAAKALAKAQVNIEMINQGSSEVSMMFAVKEELEKLSVQALYDEFFVAVPTA